jgi:UPF0755 protein
MKRGFIAFGLVVLLALIAAAGWVWLSAESLDEPLAVAAPVRFKVLPGAPLARIAASLAAQGVMSQPKTWVWYARYKGLAAAVKAGEYEIEPGTTPRALLDKMVNGQVLLHSLTIVDGWRVPDMLAALRHNPDILVTLPEQPTQLMAKLGSPGLSEEGQFLPETYRFPSGTSDLELLRQAHTALVHTLESAWAGRDPSIPLQSAQQLLIMASIVQKESGLPEELPKIAGLYQHRLSIGMRLQADPTVIYGLGAGYDGTVHSVDLHTDGPYNTYTRSGLPPTPIALAGRAVINATARPEKTDALYFVASGNGDGSHVFSVTLEEQSAAVAQYLSKLRQKSTESHR